MGRRSHVGVTFRSVVPRPSKPTGLSPCPPPPPRPPRSPPRHHDRGRSAHRLSAERARQHHHHHPRATQRGLRRVQRDDRPFPPPRPHPNLRCPAALLGHRPHRDAHRRDQLPPSPPARSKTAIPGSAGTDRPAKPDRNSWSVTPASRSPPRCAWPTSPPTSSAPSPPACAPTAQSVCAENLEVESRRNAVREMEEGAVAPWPSGTDPARGRSQTTARGVGKEPGSRALQEKAGGTLVRYALRR